MRDFEPELAFPPTLKVRLAAGEPYLSDKQVAFLVKCLRGQGREHLAHAIEEAGQRSESFAPTAEEKVELLRVVRLWPHKLRADHRVAALLACLQRDTGLSNEPPATQVTASRSVATILRRPAAAFSQFAASLVDLLK